MAKKNKKKNSGYKKSNQFQEGLEGIVRSATGGGVFKVEILGKDGSGNGIIIDAKPSGRITIHHVRITVGDKVTVQVSEADPCRGRITWRYT